MVIHHVRANKLDILKISLNLELKTSWVFFKTWSNFITSNPSGKITTATDHARFRRNTRRLDQKFFHTRILPIKNLPIKKSSTPEMNRFGKIVRY